MPTPTLPDPSPLMQVLSGARVNAALITAMEMRICGHLAEGACSAGDLAKRAGISERGALALLDLLVALGACGVEGGVYRNSPLGDAYLVPGKPTYIGDEEAVMFRAMSPSWARFSDVVRTGKPAHEVDSPKMLDFWTALTPAIGRRQRPLAEEAIRSMGLTEGEPSLLDVGGGAAVYSLAVLRLNPRARATQLDWPHVNKIALDEIAKAGLTDRFTTIDGDFRTTPPGGPYDIAVLSNIVHQEPEDSARDLMKRLGAALRPGGRLLVSDFVVDDGRTGPAFPLTFNMNMLLSTSGGRSYERRDIARLYREAGFAEPTFERVGPVSTLAVAARG
jgi:SAM-dependent methyltransferase